VIKEILIIGFFPGYGSEAFELSDDFTTTKDKFGTVWKEVTMSCLTVAGKDHTTALQRLLVADWMFDSMTFEMLSHRQRP
jgi:capsid protein